MVDKYIKEGKVAVLVSPGYGAGWVSWADEKYAEFCAFDKGLVEFVINGVKDTDIIESYLKGKGIDYVYAGGWSDVEIEWVPVGTAFEITEYDGSESLQYADRNWMIA